MSTEKAVAAAKMFHLAVQRPALFRGDEVWLFLTRGQVAVIDATDAELAEHNWHARPDKARGVFYAGRTVKSDGHCHTVLLHRVVAQRMGLDLALLPDHIDGDGLNNRRSNLRAATGSQNGYNARLSKKNTSGLKGVSWYPSRSVWVASLRVDGRPKTLGYFDTKEKAHEAWLQAALRYRGEFMRVA